MFDHGGSGPELDADAAQNLLRACNVDSALARRLSDPANALLVLDAGGERVLYASGAARTLRDALAEPDGRLDPGLRIGAQIARIRLSFDAPVLIRLHLDARRIAPPVLMTLLRAEDREGRGFVILLATGPLPKLRALPVAPPEKASSEPDVASTLETAPPTPSEEPTAIGYPTPSMLELRRFTWSSDADGTVTELSRPPGDPLRVGMLGRTWRALSESGTLRDAEGLIAALAHSQTFRTIPVALIATDGRVFELDLSGAPVSRARPEFRGFGQIRSVEGPAVSPPVSPEATGDLPQAAPMADEVVPTSKASDAATSVSEAQDADRASPGVPTDPSLSSNEHAAFREIARALGARFAGDDVHGPVPERGLPCAVMPFPTSPARIADPANSIPDTAMVATLERLPVGVIVYRENAVLFANRRLLDLTGYPDIETLDAGGGIAGLFRGLLPHAREASDTPIVLAARDGGRIGVLVEHSVLDWAGRPADLLLARDAESSEAARAHTASALAQDFAGRRDAQALNVLETLEEGIATLDSQGRLLSLNRSAAATFDLDPREVVGASFLGLFAPENAVLLLAHLHAEPGAASHAPARVTVRGSGAVLEVKVLPLRDDPQNGLCAVINPAAAPSGREAGPSDTAGAERLQAANVLTKVSQEIRSPIDRILAAVDLMLQERLGPLGPDRYRASLQDIHASGTQVLDLLNDLLELARIEAGQLDLTVTEIPLNDVVARCVALLQPQASRERIVLRTSFSSDLATFVADARCVHQAALNVIANAIAFTEAGGQVIVSTSMADRGEIALRVRDTGTGMTSDEVEVALQPFRQAGPIGPRKGTGLGLPLTKALVEANHGRFRIVSRKDEGTLVEMLFPANAATKRA